LVSARRTLAAAAWVATSFIASFAYANGLVELELESCSELDERELRRVLEAELQVQIAEEDLGATVVIVSCQQARVQLTVLDAITRKSLRRTFDLGGIEPEAWSRMAAVAAAELVVASWTELEAIGEPAVEPVGPRVEPEVVARAREAAQSYAASGPTKRKGKHQPSGELRVMALGSGRAFLENSGFLLGGGARVGYDYYGGAAWTIDGLFEGGSIEQDGRSDDVGSATIAGAIYAQHRWSTLSARAGMGLRAGIVSGRGGTQTVALWGWPLAVVSMGLRPASRLVLELSAEASYAVLPLSGGSAGPSLRGVWFSGQLGIGWLVP
jgi:hypothetical protein